MAWLAGHDRVGSFDTDTDATPERITEAVFVDEDGDQHGELRITVGGQEWWTQFAAPELIDFQGVPEAIDSAALLDVVAVMRGLREVTGKAVLLVPETLRPNHVRPYLRLGDS